MNLVRNELTKIYIVKSTWIMYILLAAIIVGIALLTNNFSNEFTTEYSEDNWREEMQQENQQYEEEMEKEEYLSDYNSNLIEKNNFHLENDIPPGGYTTWDYMLENQSLISVVSLFTIIIAAGIIANEFRWGTIKLLLIRPISRGKILLSKYTAVLLFSLSTLIFVLLLSFLVGTIFFGIGDFNQQMVIEKSHGFEAVSAIPEIGSAYGYKLVNLVMMATFAFMISSIFRNSSLAIGIAIFLMFAGNSIVAFFADKEWAKFILFANTDLQQYETGYIWVEGMTLGFSITMLFIYYAVFMALSFLFFTKRDVAGS